MSEGLQYVGKSLAEMREKFPLTTTPTAPQAQEYACGFMFSADRSRLALIRKGKPAWQAGKLNGIGGKIEAGETPLAAMKREFAEEAGINHMPWEPVSVLRGDDFSVHFFAAFDDAVDLVQTMETEEVVVAEVDDFLADPALMPNLRVMIPLALDNSGIVKPVELRDAVPQ